MLLSEMATGWDTTVERNINATCLKALLSDNRESHLDHILKDVVPADYMSHLKPLAVIKPCDVGSVLMEVIVSRPFWSKSEAVFFCRQSCWANIRSLVQLLSCDGFAVFGICHATVDPHGNSSVTLKHNMCFTIPSSVCHCRANGLIWFKLPSKYSGPFQWLVVNNFSLKVTKILFQSDIVEERGSAQTPNSELVLKSSCSSLSLVSGGSAVHTYNLMSIMCQSSPCCDVENADFDCNCEDGGCSCPKNCTAEITETHILNIKKEVKNEDEESQENTITDCLESSLVALCEKYNNARKGSRFQFLGAERMLIVQCPGCLAQFRGLSNRMYRLVNHVRTHELSKQYMEVIAKRYRLIFDRMKKLTDV